MARPLANDLRERVVVRVAAGETVRSVASVFGVSVSSVVKWSQCWRATGSAAARPMGGRRRDAMATELEYALARLAGHPSLPLRQLQSELAGCGVKVSYGALWSFVHAGGLSFKKKTVLAAETERPDIARRRARWQRHQHRIDPRRLVSIDETWVKTNMAPLRGWGPKGARLPGRAPHGHWRTMTFVGALRVDRIDAPCVFDGPINGDLFRAYVEKVLALTLRPGDVIVMDNLCRHKGSAVRNAIRAAGPPCSS